MRNRYDSMSKIACCTQPIFIGHGTADTLIPMSHGQALFAKANEPKEFFTMSGADHNDPLPLEFFTALKAFLEKNP
jgi:fermentation-respiration switch protein FrsA (DUF1100 family)